MMPAIRSIHAPRIGTSFRRRDFAENFKSENTVAASNSPGKNHGLPFSGCGVPTTALLAVVAMVMITKMELFVSEGGLKLQEAPLGSPLQLNVTVPAAAFPKTPT
jgi:hypothetical protein